MGIPDGRSMEGTLGPEHAARLRSSSWSAARALIPDARRPVASAHGRPRIPLAPSEVRPARSEVFDLRHLVKSLALGSLLPPRVVFCAALSSLRCPVAADPTQLAEALGHLVADAADLVGERGVVWVSVDPITLDEQGPGLVQLEVAWEAGASALASRGHRPPPSRGPVHPAPFSSVARLEAARGLLALWDGTLELAQEGPGAERWPVQNLPTVPRRTGRPRHQAHREVISG